MLAKRFANKVSSLAQEELHKTGCIRGVAQEELHKTGCDCFCRDRP